MAARLSGLWRVVNESGISDAERITRLLDFSTSTLRPNQPFAGVLTHLEEGTAFVDAVSFYEPGAPGMEPSMRMLRAGEAFPYDATVHRRLFAGGCAQSWDDLMLAVDDPPTSGPLQWRSLLGTSFSLGAKTTFLIFGSPRITADRPFTGGDYAFVDVLASIIAHRLQQELMRERLRFQIEHDALTGLPNRVQFRLAVKSAVESRRPCAVALLDLDDFRSIGKVNGQMVADELLVEIGSELNAISEFDAVARIDNDHFAILMPDLEDEAAATAQAQGYLSRFRRPFMTGDRDGTRLLSIGASAGIAFFPRDAADVDGLMRRALFAVEVAKSRGGGQLVYFRQEMEDAFRGRHMTRNELLRAIASDQMTLAYQPTFELTTGRLSGAEALVRWQHPTKGLLLPREFVPFAEREDEITIALGRWVMQRAIRDLSTIAGAPPGFCCYVNVSSRQLLDPEFAGSLREALQQAPQVAGLLGIEISEAAAMEHVEHATAVLAELRTLGLRIALDDFGTGYSSLSGLKRLPLNVVKIDRSFVAGLPANHHDRVLCEAMISIADRFGFATLAEGIETAQQAAWLAEQGCVYGQGFDLGVPSTWDDLQLRLRAGA